MKKRTLELTGERTTVAWAKQPETDKQPSCQKTQIGSKLLIYRPMSFSCGRSQYFLFSSGLDSSANESPAGSGPSSPIGLCSNENGGSYRSTSQIEVPKLFWDYKKINIRELHKIFTFNGFIMTNLFTWEMTNNTCGMQLLIKMSEYHCIGKQSIKASGKFAIRYWYRYQSFSQAFLQCSVFLWNVDLWCFSFLSK